jgi:hypothetical protein
VHGIYTFSLPYIFMAWFLINQKDSFAIYLFMSCASDVLDCNVITESATCDCESKFPWYFLFYHAAYDKPCCVL